MKNFYILMAIATAAMTSCKENTKPVDTSYWQGNVTTADGDTIQSTLDSYFPLEEFRTLDDTIAQRIMVDKYRKALTANVVAHYQEIKDEKNIRFMLGSGYAKNMKSDDGKTYSGEFKNELIIILDDPSVKDTIFLAYGNSVSSLRLDTQCDLGTATKWLYTIEPGKDINDMKYEWGEIINESEIDLLIPFDVINTLDKTIYDITKNIADFKMRSESPREKIESTTSQNIAVARAQAKRERKF